MIESKRSDKKKNIDKVAASLAKNPLQSEREIAKDAWVSNWTAHNAKKEVEQTWAKDNRIISLTDKDFELMQLIQKRKFERMNDTKTPVNDSDVNNWDKTAQARYTIFRWDITDEKGWLKNTVAQLSDDELLNITNGN